MNSSTSTQPTILVVDDMQICREAVTEVLRAHGFNALGAAGGEEALSLLRTKPVQLVLLDVLMPGMDGLGLLRTLRNNPNWRDLSVILLTDVADEAKVRIAANLGVQGYLLKAHFKTEDLLTRVNKLLGARQSTAVSPPTGAVSGPDSSATPRKALARETPALPCRASASQSAARPKTFRRRDKTEVLDKIRRTLELKPVPPVLHHVVSQTQNSQTSIHEIVNTIRQDQALALRVMKVANSSFYATGKPAQHLIDAAGRLGMSGIRNAVVTVVTMNHFANTTASGLVPQRFWEHSLGTAAIARSIAEEKRYREAEEFFLAGLLHDLGRLVLSTNYPRDYGAILERYASSHATLESLEQEAFGLDHAEVAREALRQLKLPEVVVQAASQHELTPDQMQAAGGREPGPLVVALANRLAHALLLGDSGSPVLYPFEDHVRALSLEPGLIATIGRETAAKLSETEMFYACQGDDHFLDPLAKELARSLGVRRIAVFAADAPHDPFSLFFEQLGWLNSDDPEIVVICGASDADLEDHVKKLEAWEHETGKTVGLLLARSDGKASSLGEAGEKRAVSVLGLPVRYTELTGAVNKIAPGSVSSGETPALP